MDDSQDIMKKVAEKLKQLPKVVRDAILSADVEQHMRELANRHKLHFDQWTTLENEVMFSLLGFQSVDELQASIEKEVGVSRETAAALTEDISKIVFAPIREMLEQNLAQPARTTDVVQSGGQEQVAATAAVPAAPPATLPTPPLTGAQAPSGEQSTRPTVLAGTPPPPALQEKAIRGPISEAYSAGEASRERRTVQGDPYREPAA